MPAPSDQPESQRKPLIAGNWKMHHDHLVAIQVVQKLSYRLDEQDYEAVDVVLCPPFTDLRTLQTLIQSDEIPVGLGAQSCHWEDAGPYTGEVSPVMLAKLEVEYVIVGHSERRALFGETDEIVSKKLQAVLRHGMTPIVCVGETLEEKEAGRTDARVTDQTRAAFAGVKGEVAGGCVVAYEPIWAIGTGRNATPDDANATIRVIRSALRELYGATADAMRILYGGSVKPGNTADLMAMPEIDGALVGGASLDPDDFARIIRYRV
jgi:triosephosphate isomerase